ncbi:hypothetical protein GBO34_00915 [Roseivirga pacifica]|uniref:hypothetical protein n=1 Tax=Roseivirga pacifica TaxID=1267423 RepID=UPI00209641AB|nr:hypothetical protein [Roseivirga pacifica]MCO6367874.1 hypothetical protein [Roseivirga pacifica]MCO6377246.1 hypothetical protein [Roseivirga pacifica]
MSKQHVNEVHELLAICRAIKSDIRQNKASKDQLPAVLCLEKNLRPVWFSVKDVRAKTIIQYERQLQLLIPADTAKRLPKHDRIEGILNTAKRQVYEQA